MALEREKIGIFGGTFDPVHLGHVAAAKAASDKLGLTKLIFIPAAVPPHKELPPEAASGEMRLEMLRLALKNIENAEVSDIEIKRGGTSYTDETVRTFKEKHPNAELWLIMGGDMLECFEKWNNFDWLKRNVYVCALSRRADTERLKAAAAELRKKYGINVVLAENDALEISSSELREMLKNRDGLRYLDPEVYAYIIKNRLFGSRAEFGWLRERAGEMLDPKRVPHVLGCEEEAAALSFRWGADVEDARCAAILHDLTKKLSLEEQLILCEKYGIIIDIVERREVKLLHSVTGAAMAEHEFGMPSEVCSAIRWHTTGKAGMSLLEKIIYISDYIEPTRTFDGVEKLRALAYSDLDSAMLEGLSMTVAEITERGKTPHQNTLLAIEYFKRSILGQ